MREGEQPKAEKLDAAEAREQWGTLLDQVCRGKQRILVEKDGIPVAAIISAGDLDALQRYEEQRARDFKALDRIGEVFKDESPEDIEREVAKAVESARAKRRGLQQSTPESSC